MNDWWGMGMAQYDNYYVRQRKNQQEEYREQALSRALAEQQRWDTTTLTNDSCDTLTLSDGNVSSDSFVVSPLRVVQYYNVPEGSVIPNFTLLQQLRASIDNWLKDALTV